MGVNLHTVLIEGNGLARAGLASLLAGSEFDPCCRFATCTELQFADCPTLKAIRANCGGRLLLIGDFGAPSQRAIEDIQGVKRQYRASTVLVLSDHYDQSYMRAVLSHGADGYLLKTMPAAALLASLELAAAGHGVLPANAVMAFAEGRAAPSAAAAPAPQARCLSDREAEIAGFIALGESNKAIARRIGITESTVKVHVKAVLRKLRVRNRTQAALWALEHLRDDSGKARGELADDAE